MPLRRLSRLTDWWSPRGIAGNNPSPASFRPSATGTAPDRSLQEQLFDALAEVKILTSQVSMHIDKEWRDKLFRQLDSLHDIDEWATGDEPIKRASFATFLKTILNVNPERRPGLALSQAGNLVGAWTTGGDRLTINFCQVIASDGFCPDITKTIQCA